MKKKDRSKFHHFAILDLPFEQGIKRVTKFYRYDENVDIQQMNEDQYILVFRHSKKKKPFATAQVMRWEGTLTRLTMHINDRQGLPHVNRYLLFGVLFVLVMFLAIGTRYLSVVSASPSAIALLFVIAGMVCLFGFYFSVRNSWWNNNQEGKIWSNLLIALSPDGLGQAKGSARSWQSKN